jgi:hypothetical protein
MIRKLIRIVAGSQSRRHGPEAVRGRLKLRPRMMALEGRTLLSTFTVNSTADDGSAGTLRWAIAQANASDQAETIVFSSVFNTPHTIRLTSGPLVLSDPAGITINGPGENLLAISGNKASRVIGVTPGSAASLSDLTITGGNVHGNGGGIQNNGGALALDDIVIRGNSAGMGGGLYNNGSVTLTDVTIHGNHARKGGGVFNSGSVTETNLVTRSNTAVAGSGVFSTRTATLTRLGLSSPAGTGVIVNQTFNGTGFPSNWQQFLKGGVAQSAKNFLMITDVTGNQAGILLNTSNVPFPVQGVTTTITAVVYKTSGSPVGNAIFGLLGPNGSNQPGDLAAGIDSQGNVFIAESDPAQKITQPNVVAVGKLKNYNGTAPVTMTLTISTTGVQITATTAAGTTKFDAVSFADLNKFSMANAFPVGAIPALVGASQPGKTGGSASFESISVSTA